MEDQLMKSMRSFTLALAGLVVTQASLFAASVLQEDFTTDPLAAGWRVFGDSRLFTWDAGVGHLQVTWDSRQTNSYFYRPLGTVLDKDDDFSFAFDLRLLELTPGINPAKANSPFQIAVGFIRLADAMAPDFLRGSGSQSPNLVEFNFFPDPGGDWQWGPSLTAVLCDRTGLNWSSGGFAPAGLSMNDTFRVTMTYTAATQALTTEIERNGEPFLTIPPATLDENFTLLRVDAVAVSSYSDAGQWPGYEGSILAHGIVDNVRITLPPLPVERISLVEGAAPGQAQCDSRVNWLYTLERTTDFQTWEPVSTPLMGTGETLMLHDTNPPPAAAFYRVQAQRP